jgi:hydrophobe/amphiphile efflux-1 (HAE1) family protein
MSKFFIHRPIFAIVISIFITSTGLISAFFLPLEQYPNLTPPLIQVSTSYNGANAKTLADDVASPLEQQILGAEDMIYMYSQNSSTGKMTLDVYFDIGSDPNMDQVNVQNLVNQALPMLPLEVQKEGISIKKQTPNFLLICAVHSPDGRYDQEFISNYATINIVTALELLQGVSSVSVIGQRDYSMRVWLRPDMLAQFGLTARDVIAAIEEQNKDFGIGQLGAAPNVHPVPLTIPMQTKGRLSTPEEFENIILRADLSGALVRLKDVGKVELGAQDYSVDGSVNNEQTVLLAVYQEYGANALSVAQDIKGTLAKLSDNFPKGISYYIPYDTTKFVHASIKEVFITLGIATLLVIAVVFAFLHHLRLTLIPVLALLVSITGTFFGLYLFGFSINTLTLFAMVLAVGIVVDDAIVVVENVDRNLKEKNLAARDAAIIAMQEVKGPIIAIVLVLLSVFIPVAFIGGIAGKLYQQFALTIAISVAISGIVALTLSPALAALILSKKTKKYAFEEKFNRTLAKITDKTTAATSFLLTHAKTAMILFVICLGATFFLLKRIPQSFVPEEDQGYLIAIATLPDGASLHRTNEVDTLVTKLAHYQEGVKQVVSLTGFSLIEGIDRTAIGTNFIVLEDWDKRKKKTLSSESIRAKLQDSFAQIEDARVVVVSPPAIQGLGTVGGIEFWLENRSNGGMESLQEAITTIIKEAEKFPSIGSVHTTAEFDNLQFRVDLDRAKSKALGVPISEVFESLQTLLGSVYVNNFNKFGRIYQVIVQALPEFREKIENVGDMYVRSSHVGMVPLKSLLTIETAKGSNLMSRFNDFPAGELIVTPSKGYTTGQAMQDLEKITKKLPPGITYGFSGQAYQEKTTQGASFWIFIASLCCVFLILAAFYEAWSSPFIILLAAPLGLFGAFSALLLTGMSNDIYFQIGLLTLIALCAKNAILITEFASKQTDEGTSVQDAALEAAKIRFRPIVMTSITFILGVVPLVLTKGAGAASRHAVGTGVLGGMISATLLVPFFVPLFFTLIYRKKNAKKD